jgi:hypothetical protein
VVSLRLREELCPGNLWWDGEPGGGKIVWSRNKASCSPSGTCLELNDGRPDIRYLRARAQGCGAVGFGPAEKYNSARHPNYFKQSLVLHTPQRAR